MSRKPRNFSETNFFHIITQGINKEKIFQTELYKSQYIKLLISYSQKSNVKILSYCIMDNHTHIVIYTNKILDMSKMMQCVNLSYGKYYNKVNNRVGFVFRDRYFTTAIYKEEQLLETIAYVHNNPVEAGIVKHAEKYKYSTYKDYLSNSGIITKDILQLTFGSENYVKGFKNIHRKNITAIPDVIESYLDYKFVIQSFVDNCKTDLKEIKKNKNLLKELIVDIKYKSGLNGKQIAKILEINKNTITKVLRS